MSRPLPPLDDRLRHLAEQLAAEPEPRVDWSRMEKRLFLRPVEPAFPWRRYLPAGAGLAAAAVAILALGTVHIWPDAKEQLVAFGTGAASSVASQVRDADSRTVVAHLDAQQTLHPGIGQWLLHAPGKARWMQRLGVVEVMLDQGKLDAAIEPQERAESFVVLAGGVRVAVHGTRFSVETRPEGDVTVTLREGVVWVSAAHPTGSLLSPIVLHAPAQGRFHVDSGRLTQLPEEGAEEAAAAVEPSPGSASPVETAARPTDASTPAAPGAKSPRVAPAAVQPPVASTPVHPLGGSGGGSGDPARIPGFGSPEAASAPPANEVLRGHDASTTPAGTATLSRLQSLVLTCLQQSRRGHDGPQVSVTTAAQVHLDAQGRVETVHFDPPLAPSAQQCVHEQTQSWAAIPSLADGDLNRSFFLSF